MIKSEVEKGCSYSLLNGTFCG